MRSVSVLDPAAKRPAEPPLDAAATGAELREPGRRGARQSRSGAPDGTRWTILVYLASRALLLAVALLTSALTHSSLLYTLGRWDGTWYARVASEGYPAHTVHSASTLGFFPLLPLAMRLVGLALPGPLHSFVLAGVLVSCLGGLIATLLVQRLATGWWGEASGRRAAVLFCFFPGSVVFAMAYGEGLLIPLAAGCILALQQRRWVLAGALAGVATAVQPDALALFPVCAASAALELRRGGWSSRKARASLLAPALSLTGIAAFALYLWARTGTPFATLQAQRYGWREKFNPLAIVHQGEDIWHELTKINAPHFALNLSTGRGADRRDHPARRSEAAVASAVDRLNRGTRLDGRDRPARARLGERRAQPADPDHRVSRRDRVRRQAAGAPLPVVDRGQHCTAGANECAHLRRAYADAVTRVSNGRAAQGRRRSPRSSSQ